jgi:GNAT superfamily N-acetyltransferase
VSENAELTRPVDEAGPTAGPGATVEAGRLDRSLEMGKSVAPRSAAAVPGGSENGLPEVVALRDGYIVGIRAVSLGDGKLLRRMFSRLSRESIYWRFHMPYPSVPEWAVALFTSVDEAQGKYLVVVAGNEIVGHAMYARSEDGRSADIGILVEDEWQRRGIGKLLLSRLAAAARRPRIEAFTGVVLGENRPMMRLLAAVFTGIRSTLRGGQYEIYAPLSGFDTAQDPYLRLLHRGGKGG